MTTAQHGQTLVVFTIISAFILLGTIALVGNAQVVGHYEGLIAGLSKDLAPFEKIKKVSLLTREFSLEAGELTPTLKVRRAVVLQKYATEVDALYAEH